MDPSHDPSPLARAATLLLLATIFVILIGGVVSGVAISRNRSFQVDEVEHVHAAYNVADGRALYRDFWEGHNPLLYVVLLPLVDVDDPVGTFRRSRLLVLVLLSATIGLTCWTANRLAGPSAAVVSGGLLLFATSFAERGIEVRPDNMVALAIAGALAAQVSSLAESRRLSLQGLLLGLGFLATSKVIVATAAFGTLWVVLAFRRRRLFLLVAPAATWLAPLALAAIVLAALGLLDDWARWNLLPYFQNVARRAGPNLAFPPSLLLTPEALRNPFFVASSLSALLLVAVASARRNPAARDLWFPAGLSLACLAFLRVNPYPFPYNLVTVLPTFAVLCGVFWGLVAVRLSRLAPPALASAGVCALCLAFAAVPSAERRISKSVPGNGQQLATLGAIQRVTGPTDRVFDLAGLYFRPDAYPVFTMTGVMLRRYERGFFPAIIPALEANEVTAFIDNYRLRALPDREKRFLAEHFVR
ncbi:MAG: hypothetical protein HY900_14265, partial [Deltaproteobacteria bacterium]|nr:hypothetical protein [Deltaproteobacteria bacterium]